MPSPKMAKSRLRQHAAAALREFRPKGRERWGMFFVGCAVACYIAFVICSKLFLLFALTEGWQVYLLFPVLAPVIYWLMSLALPREKPGVQKRKKKKETPKEAILRRLKGAYPAICAAKQKLSPTVFFGAFLGVFAVLLLGLLAQYPGGFVRADIGWQWTQVQTGNFDSWHPPAHTLLIWLVTRIVNSYGFFIAVQVLFFSLLVGYMASTLRAWGMQRLWVALFVLATLSAHATRGIMLYAYKDSMFTCFVLWAAVCLVNIVLSHGEWLGKWGNRIALAAALAFVSLIRLNGFFFTVPVLVLLFALYGKKRAAASAFSGGLALLLVLGVMGPLYRAVGVKNYKGQMYEEVISPPLNILSSIYLIKPGALGEDGDRLMRWIATPQQWEQIGAFGDYRGIKGANTPSFSGGQALFQKELDQMLDAFAANCPPEEFVSILWHAVKNEPALAMKAFAVASRTLWDPAAIEFTFDYEIPAEYIYMVMLDSDEINEDFDKRLFGAYLREGILAETKEPFFRVFQKFQAPYRVLEWMFRHLTPGSILHRVGMNLLALLLAMWFSLRRRRGWEALLLALPSLACSLPNFYALIGPDYRWLHYIVVITMPLVLVCLAKVTEPKKGVK